MSPSSKKNVQHNVPHHLMKSSSSASASPCWRYKERMMFLFSALMAIVLPLYFHFHSDQFDFVSSAGNGIGKTTSNSLRPPPPPRRTKTNVDHRESKRQRLVSDFNQNQNRRNERKGITSSILKHSNTTRTVRNPATTTAATKLPTHSNRKTTVQYMTYSRYQGRLNNQWFNLVAALTMSTRLNRTLLVPPEINKWFDMTYMFSPDKGYWNLDWIYGNYSLEYISDPNDPRLNVTDGTCHAKYWKELSILSAEEISNKYQHCSIIHMGGKTGLLQCKQDHRFCVDEREAYKIYQRFRPGPIVEQHLQDANVLNKSYKYGVHSRTIGGSGVDAGNAEICSKHIDKVAKSHFNLNLNYTKFVQGQCHFNDTLMSDLGQRTEFLLASDGSLDWNTYYGNNAIIVSEKALSSSTLGQKGKESGLLASLLELWSLTSADYFYGNLFSTFSMSICLLRGEHLKYKSNVCWILMHPDTQYAELPPPVSLPTATTIPTHPTESVHHAFVRSQDQHFVIIDRYLVENPDGRRKVAILADGVAPLAFSIKQQQQQHGTTKSKININKQWAVRANFTCSMGSQHNSQAHVVLMDGNKSPYEHYYEKIAYKTDDWPFSGNNDKFRTMIIYCEDLAYDEHTAIEEPLTLSSPDGSFTVTVDTPFVVPTHMSVPPEQQQATTDDDDDAYLTAVLCVCPLYGVKEPHWMIEYIEYHLQAGVSHVHIYDLDFHSTPILEVYQEYQRLGVLTYHDWSLQSSKRYTFEKTYERGKWTAQTDCLLRSRGFYDYALFSDMDEVWVGDTTTTTSQSSQSDSLGYITSGLVACQKARDESNGVVIGCGVHSHTISSVYTIFQPEVQKKTLLLERYTREEAHPYCPANCRCLRSVTNDTTGLTSCIDMYRKYHTGRAKLIVNVRNLSIEPRPIFTHGISRDYDDLERIQYQLPDESLHVRHYQGHWFVKAGKLDESLEEKEAPIPGNILTSMRKSIQRSKVLSSVYNSKVATGLDWIKPVLDRGA